MQNKWWIFLLLPAFMLATIDTAEDKAHFQAFVDIYEKNADLIQQSNQYTIPKELHFIWLNIEDIPKRVKKCLKTWVQAHPTWKINLWTDYRHTPPMDNMQIRSIASMHANLPKEYFHASNIAEKTLLLRYAILLKHGGVYLDCDVKCFENIEPLIRGADFVTTYDINPKPILSSSVYASPYFIAAKPAHLIIQKTLEETQKNWNEVHAYFPYNDNESEIYKAHYLTCVPFTQEIIQKAKERDIVLPRATFASYGRHMGLQTWIRTDVPLRQLVEKKTKLFAVRLKKYIFYIYPMCALSLIALVSVFCMRRKHTHELH